MRREAQPDLRLEAIPRWRRWRSEGSVQAPWVRMDPCVPESEDQMPVGAVDVWFYWPGLIAAECCIIHYFMMSHQPVSVGLWRTSWSSLCWLVRDASPCESKLVSLLPESSFPSSFVLEPGELCFLSIPGMLLVSTRRSSRLLGLIRLVWWTPAVSLEYITPWDQREAVAVKETSVWPFPWTNPFITWNNMYITNFPLVVLITQSCFHIPGSLYILNSVLVTLHIPWRKTIWGSLFSWRHRCTRTPPARWTHVRQGRGSY